MAERAVPMSCLAHGEPVLMMRAYVRPGGRGDRRWLAVGWYCDRCGAFVGERSG